MSFEHLAIKRVLIVEDETIIALDLECGLRRLGFEVVGVADHRDEALALFAETKPDLVLMDVLIRGPADGIATAQAIGELSDVPVIFLTAFADDATLGRASGVSPYGYVIKPIDERALIATITMAFSRHRADRHAHLVRCAVEASPLGLAIVDARGAERRVVFANHAITAMGGVEAGASLEALPCLRTTAPSQESVERLHTALARRTHAEGLVEGSGADGHRAWVAASVSPLADSDGNVTHLLVSQQEVSKSTGAGLAATRRLEVVGLLSAGLASDFDRTLSEIITGAETLRLDSGDPWTRADLDEILQSAQHAMLLARRLDAMAPRRGEVEAPSAELSWVITETLTTIERLVGAKIQVGLELDPEPMQVAMDPTAIQEVLLRLVGRARASMRGGGCLTIHASRLHAHPPEREPWQCVRVEVTDTGDGFVPADAEPDAEFAATAMMVDHYGGALRVESRYGMGTRFVLDLPLSDGSGETSPGGALPREFGRAQGECCLVAESRPALRSACARALSRAGFSVVEVSHGDAAVRELDARGAAVRLVVTELSLPSIDGAALARYAQARSPGVATLVTAGHLERWHGDIAPGVAVLWKPFSIVRLVRRALELLRESDASGVPAS